MEMRTTATSSASWRQVQHVSLILQRSVGLQQWNGDAVAPATPGALRTRIHDACRKGRFPPMNWHGISVSWSRSWGSNYYYASGLGFGNGNGEWRRCSWIPDQAAGDAGSSTLYWGWVSGVMDNAEWSTEHGNIYSALSLRC